MSTPCRIIRDNHDGTITAISAHWDGYPAYAGAILHDHYDSNDAVAMLLNLGELSQLGETPFEAPQRLRRFWERGDEYKGADAERIWYLQQSRYCISYKGDGAKGRNAHTLTWAGYDKGKCRMEAGDYEYLWDGAEWRFRETWRGETEFHPLREHAPQA